MPQVDEKKIIIPPPDEPPVLENPEEEDKISDKSVEIEYFTYGESKPPVKIESATQLVS
jgi:hypothetical protein